MVLPIRLFAVSPSGRLLRLSVAALAASALLVSVIPPAQASPTGEDYAYAGSGFQYAKWQASHVPDRLELKVSPTTSMSKNRCMDAMLDWETTFAHYDSRVVRSCLPGRSEASDPGGDGWWSEPNSYWLNISDMKKGQGYLIDDQYGSDGFPPLSGRERFAGTTTDSIYESAPRTTVDCWARTRTRYELGHVDVTPNDGGSPTGAGNC